MIELSHVSKVFGAGSLAVRALDDVSLAVGPGEVVLLVGPSGSGKSTLLSIIGCTLAPTAGSVRILGEEIGSLGEARLPEIRRARIGFVFQGDRLIEALTARDNVALPLVLRGVPRRAAARRADEVLARIGLAREGERLPRELSGGQRQRIGVARALVGDPPILLADEPTSALDHASGLAVMDALTGLAREGGHAAVIVTHDSRLFGYGDRLLPIEDGRLVAGPERALTPSTGGTT